MRRETSPTLVSHIRSRDPFPYVVRLGVRWYRAAPIRSSLSASIKHLGQHANPLTQETLVKVRPRLAQTGGPTVPYSVQSSCRSFLMLFLNPSLKHTMTLCQTSLFTPVSETLSSDPAFQIIVSLPLLFVHFIRPKMNPVSPPSGEKCAVLCTALPTPEPWL